MKTRFRQLLSLTRFNLRKSSRKVKHKRGRGYPGTGLPHFRDHKEWTDEEARGTPEGETNPNYHAIEAHKLAVEAGANPKTTRHIGRGTEGAALLDHSTGHVYKVPHEKGDADEEHAYLQAIQGKTVAKRFPKPIKLHKPTGVLVKEHIPGEHPGYAEAGFGTPYDKKSDRLQGSIRRASKKVGYTAPEVGRSFYTQNVVYQRGSGALRAIDAGYAKKLKSYETEKPESSSRGHSAMSNSPSSSGNSNYSTSVPSSAGAAKPAKASSKVFPSNAPIRSSEIKLGSEAKKSFTNNLYIDLNKAIPSKLSDDVSAKLKPKKDKTLSELVHLKEPTPLDDPKYAPGRGASNNRTATQAAGHIDPSSPIHSKEAILEAKNSGTSVRPIPKGTKPDFITRYGEARVLRDWLHYGKKPDLDSVEVRKSSKKTKELRARLDTRDRKQVLLDKYIADKKAGRGGYRWTNQKSSEASGNDSNHFTPVPPTKEHQKDKELVHTRLTRQAIKHENTRPREQSNDTFHGTRRDNLKSILKEGLKPSHGVGSSPYVFTSTDIKDTEPYSDKRGTTLRVRNSKDKLVSKREDPKIMTDTYRGSKTPISSKKIEVATPKGFTPLKKYVRRSIIPKQARDSSKVKANSSLIETFGKSLKYLRAYLAQKGK